MLEGGVGWACNLLTDLLGHWEKRNARAMEANVRPTNLDTTTLAELFARYGGKTYQDKMAELMGCLSLVTPFKSLEELSAREDNATLDDFVAAGITSAEDLRQQFAEHFYFGCEADDVITAWAFDWYPGIQEVIADLRAAAPQTTIVLGGVYATLCPQHAHSLGADLVIDRTHLEPLWHLLQLTPRLHEPPLWEAYADLRVGVLKLADGCPCKCTYCSVPQVYPPFVARPLERSLAELVWLRQCGARQVAFYDDALLFKPDQLLVPFLRQVMQRGLETHFHTPNALNARFITKDIARLMVQAGFKTFYLGFESSAYAWQRRTGGKVYAHELAQAVEHLVSAGADIRQITAYLIIAHPQTAQQDVEASMHFAHRLGLRLMLSEFSPIPGTPDGERCRAWVDLDEPLWHNKTVFPLVFLGAAEVQRLKVLCRELNGKLEGTPRLSADTATPPSALANPGSSLDRPVPHPSPPALTAG